VTAGFFSGAWFLVHLREIRPYGSSTPSLASPRQPVAGTDAGSASSCRLLGCQRRDKKGMVRIVSHLPDVVASSTQGRHRSATTTGSHARVAGLHAFPIAASPARTGAHVRVASHQRPVQRARNSKPIGAALGIVLAAAPWAFVLFAPVSEGASQPVLAAHLSPSPNPPNYPPLIVVPFDSSAPSNTVTSSTPATTITANGTPVAVSAGAAAAPPQWLVNSQLRQPASAVATAPLISSAVLDSLKATGIPRRVLAAYIYAATTEDRQSPSCGLSWQVLAGIGYIESDHARSGGSANQNWLGIANPPIYGPLLDGQNGMAVIADSDHGVLDGSAAFDRAVGPMQFLPSTWQEYEVGASGQAAPNPQNIDDATLSAARYLCATGPDLRTPDGLIAAVYSYNHSFSYVSAVLSVAIRYAGGHLPGGASALQELPALAQTASSLPSAAPTSALLPSPTPTPTPAPMAPPTPPPSSTAVPSLPPAPPTYPVPPPLPMPSPSVPGLPTEAPPQASTPPTVSPTDVASPTDSPSPSDDPGPTATASLSAPPDSSAPSSAAASPSSSPSALESTDSDPSSITETP
jgi:membrane-bound lytic murein transglycosylase B